jgi:hypothetical protein
MDYNDDGVVDPLLAADDEVDEVVEGEEGATTEEGEETKSASVWDIGADGEIEEAV